MARKGSFQGLNKSAKAASMARRKALKYKPIKLGWLLEQSPKLAVASSLILRAGVYFVLRWILAPPLIPVLFVVGVVNILALVAGWIQLSRATVLDVEQTTERDPKTGVSTTTQVTTFTRGGQVWERSEVLVNGRPSNATRPTETPLEPKESELGVFRHLISGSSSSSWEITVTVILLQVILIVCLADRLYGELGAETSGLSFVRLGHVSDTQARFLLREPDQSALPVFLEMRMKNPQAPFDSPVWQAAGGVARTDDASDYTAVLDVRLAHAEQRLYEWRTTNHHAGEFWSAPKAGAVPSIHGGNYTFLSTSCMISRTPYVPQPLEHPLAIPGTRHLARLLPSLQAQFMLFLGDFIYADVPWFFGQDAKDYRKRYRNVYASPDWRPIAQNLSWVHVLDDHEIKNDWSSSQTGLYHAAVEPYNLYHSSVNPPLAKQADARGQRMRVARANATYFEFTQGPASFFLLDTRSFRSSNGLPADDANKTMLGAAQKADFLAFLRKPEPRGVQWKIVASSVPFTQNWRVNRRDTWGGFLAERQELLEAMWDAGRHGVGVVVLSGDRHEFAATRFAPPANSTRWPRSVAVHEFSASPLSQFFSPVRSYFEWGSGDTELKYINWGNSKFGAVTIMPPDDAAGVSRMHYRVFVDGAEAWSIVLNAPKAVVGKSGLGALWDRLAGH